eukprot:4592353-Amphidinium_carterae.1
MGSIPGAALWSFCLTHKPKSWVRFLMLHSVPQALAQARNQTWTLVALESVRMAAVDTMVAASHIDSKAVFCARAKELGIDNDTMTALAD